MLRTGGIHVTKMPGRRGIGAGGGRGRGLALAAAFLALLAAAFAPCAALAAAVTVRVDLSSQQMQVIVGGQPAYLWNVSTARPGYRTPVGSFKPVRLERVWYSTIYDNAPMPYSIFFHRGYAIHGTTEIKRLGLPVSHGCIRLHPDNARILFALVREHGKDETDIVISK